jgi:hypothetical protein
LLLKSKHIGAMLIFKAITPKHSNMKKIYLFLIAIIVLSACTSPKNDKKEAPKPFELQIDPEKSQVVTHDGLILIIPKDVFVHKDGEPVKEPVILQIKTAFKLSQMIDYGLETRTKDGILVSSGMFHLEAKTKSGKEVTIAKDKAITAQVAQSVSDSNNYQIFSSQNGKEWESPQPKSNYLTYLPLDKHATLYVYHGEKAGSFYTKYKKEYKGYDFLGQVRSTYINDSSYSEYCFGNPPFFSHEKLDKTFIASKEYEDRFFAFPPFPEEGYTDIHCTYLKHLTKPLWEVDSIILEDRESQLKNTLERGKTDTYVNKLKSDIEKLKFFKNQYKTVFSTEGLSTEEMEKLQQVYKEINTTLAMQSYSVRTLGWHNLDCLPNADLYPTNFQVETNIEAKVILLLKNSRVLLNLDSKKVKTYSYPRMPYADAYILGIASKNGDIYFAKKEIKIGANNKISLDLERCDSKVFEKAIDDIEKGYQ